MLSILLSKFSCLFSCPYCSTLVENPVSWALTIAITPQLFCPPPAPSPQHPDERRSLPAKGIPQCLVLSASLPCRWKSCQLCVSDGIDLNAFGFAVKALRCWPISALPARSPLLPPLKLVTFSSFMPWWASLWLCPRCSTVHDHGTCPSRIVTWNTGIHSLLSSLVSAALIAHCLVWAPDSRLSGTTPQYCRSSL